MRALHLGKFQFKGSNPVDMVSVVQAQLEQRHVLLPRGEPKGKGRRIAEASGVADSAVTPLPDVLEGRLRDAFMEEAGAAGCGMEGVDVGDAAAEYSEWLSRELSRRKLLRRHVGRKG